MSKYVVYCYNHEYCGKKAVDGEEPQPYYDVVEIEARAGNEVTSMGDLIIYTKDNEDTTILHTIFASGEWSRVQYVDEDSEPSPAAIEKVGMTVLDAIKRTAGEEITRTEGGAGA